MDPLADLHDWRDEHEIRRRVEQAAAEARWAENASRKDADLAQVEVDGMDDMMEAG
jgi:hypothetical protein